MPASTTRKYYTEENVTVIVRFENFVINVLKKKSFEKEHLSQPFHNKSCN